MRRTPRFIEGERLGLADLDRISAWAAEYNAAQADALHGGLSGLISYPAHAFDAGAHTLTLGAFAFLAAGRAGVFDPAQSEHVNHPIDTTGQEAGIQSLSARIISAPAQSEARRKWDSGLQSEQPLQTLTSAQEYAELHLGGVQPVSDGWTPIASVVWVAGVPTLYPEYYLDQSTAAARGAVATTKIGLSAIGRALAGETVLASQIPHVDLNQDDALRALDLAHLLALQRLALYRALWDGQNDTHALDRIWLSRPLRSLAQIDADLTTTAAGVATNATNAATNAADITALEATAAAVVTASEVITYVHAAADQVMLPAIEWVPYAVAGGAVVTEWGAWYTGHIYTGEGAGAISSIRIDFSPFYDAGHAQADLEAVDFFDVTGAGGNRPLYRTAYARVLVGLDASFSNKNLVRFTWVELGTGQEATLSAPVLQLGTDQALRTAITYKDGQSETVKTVNGFVLYMPPAFSASLFAHPDPTVGFSRHWLLTVEGS